MLAELARRETLVRAIVTGDAALVRHHEEQLELVLDACSKVRLGRALFESKFEQTVV